jgi:DNA-binding Lrp family transcriptional regulator
MRELDATDRHLLDILQTDFPLVPEPFAAIATDLDGQTPTEAIERTQRLKDEGLIRQISAIFDSRRLGYQSTLAAFQVEDRRLDEVAATVSAHPGVSHNYARTHAYNLWFTLTVPAEDDIEATIADLARRTAVARYLILPSERRFKLGVRFAMQAASSKQQVAGSKQEVVTSSQPEKGALSDFDRGVIRELQKDIEITARPFAGMARRLGLSEEELLNLARRYQTQGVMRRYSAVLEHRKAGFTANAMGCWIVPVERIEEVGQIMASFPQVSHCYQRPTYPDWPYNLLTMIHGHSRKEVEALARRMAQETDLNDYTLLYSIKEYKKKRIQYFV